MWVQSGCGLWLCLSAFHRVHWWHMCRIQDPPNAGSGPLVVCSLPLVVCSPPFVLSLLCLWCIACKYASISRFKGVFSEVLGFRVGLYCLGGLRGLCGFCVRVELGG